MDVQNENREEPLTKQKVKGQTAKETGRKPDRVAEEALTQLHQWRKIQSNSPVPPVQHRAKEAKIGMAMKCNSY